MFFLKAVFNGKTRYLVSKKKTTAKKKSIFPLYTPNKRAILIEALPFLNTMYLLFDEFFISHPMEYNPTHPEYSCKQDE